MPSAVCLLILAGALSSPFQICDAKSFEDDVTLSQSEKEIFLKFKSRIQGLLKEEYQKEDLYVLRWLREKHFNMEEAEKMLTTNLIWRESYGMDKIDSEDWSEMEADYPYFVSGYDNEGKPTAVANFDEWDIRKGVLQGKRDKIIRWMTKGIQDAVKHVRELQLMGKNVTRWNFIINMKNFNLIQQGCIQCLPVYIGFVRNWENYFPDSVDKLILLNAPSIFELVLSIIRPLMSEDSKDSLLVFGTNSKDWKPFLDKFINPNQLPPEYGGTQLVRNLRYNVE